MAKAARRGAPPPSAPRCGGTTIVAPQQSDVWAPFLARLSTEVASAAAFADLAVAALVARAGALAARCALAAAASPTPPLASSSSSSASSAAASATTTFLSSSSSSEAAAAAAPLASEAEAIATEALRLEAFVSANAAAASRLLSVKCGAGVGIDAGASVVAPLWRRRFRFDALVPPLSDVHACLRRLRGASASRDERDVESVAPMPPPSSNGGVAVWVPPSVFTRSTTKHWVRPAHVLAVKLALVKHLPLLLFRPCSSAPTLKTDDDSSTAPSSDTVTHGADPADLPPVDAQRVTSVYLDTPDLSCYSTRLVREEGATLLRLRWYGTPSPAALVAASPPARRATRLLFFERKTHHESWADEPSVKERFPASVAEADAILRIGRERVSGSGGGGGGEGGGDGGAQPAPPLASECDGDDGGGGAASCGECTCATLPALSDAARALRRQARTDPQQNLSLPFSRVLSRCLVLTLALPLPLFAGAC